jgi:hypothetical protein
MTVTRIQGRQSCGERWEPEGDYFVVESESGRWFLSAVMARHVERALDQTPTPRWVTFVDLFGARVRVRSAVIQSVAQSTAEQRAADRALWRMLESERRAEGEWD